MRGRVCHALHIRRAAASRAALGGARIARPCRKTASILRGKISKLRVGRLADTWNTPELLFAAAAAAARCCCAGLDLFVAGGALLLLARRVDDAEQKLLDLVLVAAGVEQLHQVRHLLRVLLGPRERGLALLVLLMHVRTVTHELDAHVIVLPVHGEV